MLPGVGVTVNGATRWLGAGPLQFQPSELLKLALVLYAAQLLAARPRATKTLGGLVKPLLIVVALACALLLKQPDMGTAMVICFAIGALLMAAGTPTRHLAMIAGVLAGLGADPWRSSSPTGARGSRRSSTRSRTPADSGFQAVQALTAIGSGGFFGVGLGESVQKIFYLPEAHTDMILAIIGEELGLVGILGVIVLYGMIAYAGLRTAKLARDLYSKLLAAGITSLILCQAHAQLLRGARDGAAHRRAAAVPLLREHEPDRAAGRDGAAAERGRHGRSGPARTSKPRLEAIEGGAEWGRSVPKVVIAAGGTAGHVVPALAVADALRARGAEVEFVGGERAEAELVPAAGYPFHALRVAGIDRRNPLRAARAVLLAAGATVGEVLQRPVDLAARVGLVDHAAHLGAHDVTGHQNAARTAEVERARQNVVVSGIELESVDERQVVVVGLLDAADVVSCASSASRSFGMSEAVRDGML